jgi:P pilus assembly chaperone PapD
MCKILLIFTTIITTFFNIEALTVVPFVHSFDPKDDNEKTFQYYVGNKTGDFLAFEISVFRRKLDKRGNDILVRDKKSFMLMPSQIIIPPHSQRSIKVKWRGNEEFKQNPQKEQAFRVVMTQFPVNLNKKKEKKQASIQVIYEIKASLYATPKDAKPDLKLAYENAKIIALKNDGNRRAELKRSNLIIHDKKITDLVKPDEIETVVMPGTIREYTKKSVSTSR